MNPTVPAFYPPGTLTAPCNPCATCRHHFEVTPEQWPRLAELGKAHSLHLCLRHGVMRDPITGEVMDPTQQTHCRDERLVTLRVNPNKYCGPEGHCWQPQDPTPAPRS